MNTNHLVYILETYRSGSVNQAAKNCFISQSSLSSIIKNVENEIGYPIFRRTKSGIVATPSGEKFMLSAEKIINEREIIQRIPDILPDNNSLTIIASRAAFFSQCFFDFSREFPCPIAHDSFLGAGIIENFKNVTVQNARIGLLSMFESRIRNYNQVANQYVLDFSILKTGIPASILVSKRHPLATKKQVTRDDLSNYPFVVDAHIEPEDTLGILNIRNRNKILIVTDRGTTYDAVRKGRFFSVGLSLPQSDLHMMECVCRSVYDVEPFSICMIKMRSYQMNQRETNFVCYLQQRLDAFFAPDALPR